AGAGELARPPRHRRPRPARGAARPRPPGHPPAVHPAEGGVPQLRQAPRRPRRLAGGAGRPPTSARGPPGRPARRRPRPIPREASRTTEAEPGTREESLLMSDTMTVRRRREIEFLARELFLRAQDLMAAVGDLVPAELAAGSGDLAPRPSGGPT